MWGKILRCDGLNGWGGTIYMKGDGGDGGVYERGWGGWRCV
jgi:hypothetical protein